MSEKLSNKFEEIYKLILCVSLTICFVIGAIKIGELLLNAIKEIIDVYPTIAVALITGLLAFFSVPIGKYFENSYTIKNQIRKQREDIYIEFLSWIIKNALNGEINNNENIISEIKEKQNKIVIYASDKVLKAWIRFRNSALSASQNQDPNISKEEKTKKYFKEQALEIENLILAIRKELGYSNKNIQKYDILRLYINDIDNYIEK